MIRHFIILLILIGFALAFSSCEESCEDIVSGKYDDQISQIKEQCDCEFKIECDESLNTGEEEGILATTYRNEHDSIIIKLASEVEEETLKHEIIHALTYCQNYTDTARTVLIDIIRRHPEIAETPDPDCISAFIRYIEIIMSELIAYREFRELDDEGIDRDRFPDPDQDDLAILDGFDVARRFLESLPEEVRNAVREKIGMANLAPGDVSADDPDYVHFKEKLQEIADRFAEQNRECRELIDSTISFD